MTDGGPAQLSKLSNPRRRGDVRLPLRLGRHSLSGLEKWIDRGWMSERADRGLFTLSGIAADSQRQCNYSCVKVPL